MDNKTLADLGKQHCFACQRLYHAPTRVYWPLPCGHGFCTECLGREAKKVRQAYNDAWLQSDREKGIKEFKIGSSLDEPGLSPKKPGNDSQLPRLALGCPICQSEAPLVQIGL